MRKIPTCPDVLAPEEETLVVPDVADHLGVPVTRVHALLQEGKIVAVDRRGVPQVPALLLDDDGVNKFAAGALAVLADGGFRPEEALTWLWTEDESLPGRPIDGLHGHLAREVIRRAQAMAF
ncbi:Rv2175c family DNA-binding protein [uncultured Corynebacterium sp.]|uniref:Rv2175c family DNA-binding protein n=1 Tax=uncultured Corynebacterium sp. TaxID=159447 RepID=UPI0025E1A1F5|nr:Rv2175c family DNA-binding protein [uncultured Corynebacterium sp.]